MSYTPVIPVGGIAGWRFLERTGDAQRAAFADSAQIRRDSAYFADNIATIDSADALMKDRTLLRVALTAFGLEDDLSKGAWVRKVLEEGTDSEDAFANRLSEDVYAEFSKTFGFGNAGGSRTADPGFAAMILKKYEAHLFEVAVGDVNESMRFALHYREGLADLAAEGKRNNTAWYTLLGDKPLRTVMESALGMPSEIGKLDIDQQLSLFKKRARSVFGTDDIAALATPDRVEKALNTYLARAQAEAGPTPGTPGYAALTLLQGRSSGLSSAGIANLILSTANGR